MKIFDEKGVTLYELLAVFTIMMIVLPVIYGLFTTGYKLYNKIQIEGQLRDDADYAATMIMNEFYSFPFDYVKSTPGSNELELVDATSTTISKEENKNFYSVDQNAANKTTNSVVIELVDGEDGKKTISIAPPVEEKPLDVFADFRDTEISLSCNKTDDSGNCESGMIKLEFNLDHERLENPLQLVSEFGF